MVKVIPETKTIKLDTVEWWEVEVYTKLTFEQSKKLASYNDNDQVQRMEMWIEMLTMIIKSWNLEDKNWIMEVNKENLNSLPAEIVEDIILKGAPNQEDTDEKSKKKK